MVKLKKSQLKELIRQAIVEDIMDKEIKNPKTGNMVKVRTALQLPDEHPANKKAKDMIAKSPIGGKSKKKKGFFSKLSKLNPFSKKDDEPKEKPDSLVPDGPQFLGNSTKEGEDAEEVHDRVGEFIDDNEGNIPEEYVDKLKDLQKKAEDIGLSIFNNNNRTPAGTRNKIKELDDEVQEMMDDIEQKAMDGEFDESIKESRRRKYTIKEVRMWMKKLEENRYKKVYNSDARRVAWMVNNEGVELSKMPKSMSKKWTKAQYGRERYLATEFIKAKSEQMTESKLRGMIRGIIKEQLNEDYKNSEWEVYVKDEKGKEKIVKKAKSKRAATILYNKIIKSDDYYEVGMKVVKEGNLKEAYRSQSIFFDKKDKSKLEKLLKKNKGKFPFNPSGESVVNWSLNDKGSKGLEWRGIPKEKYNKAVEFFMKNKLNPRG